MREKPPTLKSVEYKKGEHKKGEHKKGEHKVRPSLILQS